MSEVLKVLALKTYWDLPPLDVLDTWELLHYTFRLAVTLKLSHLLASWFCEDLLQMTYQVWRHPGRIAIMAFPSIAVVGNSGPYHPCLRIWALSHLVTLDGLSSCVSRLYMYLLFHCLNSGNRGVELRYNVSTCIHKFETSNTTRFIQQILRNLLEPSHPLSGPAAKHWRINRGSFDSRKTQL